MILNITEKENEKIEQLRSSGTGEFLVEYCERLRSFLRDFKNWPDRNIETIKAVEMADKIIEDNLVNRFKVKNLKVKGDSQKPWE
jgi:hypothetical protein